MLSRTLFGLAVLLATTRGAAAQVPRLFPQGPPPGPLLSPPTPVTVQPAAVTGVTAAQPRPEGRAVRLGAPVRAAVPATPPATTVVREAPPAAAAPAMVAGQAPPLMTDPVPVSVESPTAQWYTPAELGFQPRDCDDGCDPPGRVWANFEWLFWATAGQRLPPLATSAPVGTDRTLAGTLGSPNTAILYGGRRVNTDFRNGFRLTGGLWLDEDRTSGVEGDFFFLERSRAGFAAASNGSQIISRPFFNALTGRPDVELVSFPGVVGGSLTVDARSRVIGGGVNRVCNLCCGPCGRVDLVCGYRYFNLTDDLEVREDLTALSGQSRVPPGFRFLISDRFRTENHFHGGVIGAVAERRFGWAFVGARASVALGGNRQVTEISGSTTSIAPGGPPAVFPGGLLAQPTNIGRYERTRFAVLPEVGLRAGVQLTEHARVYAGYNFLYLSNVARAGDQVDLRVNPNLLPPRTADGGPAVPALTPRTTDFWIHGINVGLEVRF